MKLTKEFKDKRTEVFDHYRDLICRECGGRPLIVNYVDRYGQHRKLKLLLPDAESLDHGEIVGKRR